MDLSYHARKKFANTLAKNAGLTLVEELINLPRTNGRTIYTPIYKSNWEEDSKEYIEWWSSFIHEIYHNIHPDDFDLIKKYDIDMKSEFGFLLNLIIDHNIEYSEKGKYPGLDKLNQKGMGQILPEVFKSLKSASPHNPKMEALFVFDGIIRSKWNPYISNITKETEGLSEETHDNLAKLYPFAAEWERAKSAEENYDLCKRIAEALDITNEPPQSSKDGESGNEGEESDGEESEGKKKSGSGIVDYLDLLKHTHDDNGSKGSIKISYENWKSSGEWVSGKFKVKIPNGIYNTEFISNVNKVKVGSTVANDMYEYLQVLTEHRIEVGCRRGRINPGALWKHKVYGWDTDTGSRVFSQLTQEEVLDTAVFLLVDASASMYGSKFTHAVKSALILNDTFKELDIPLTIQSFTDQHDCIQYINKEFDSEITEEELLKSFATVYNDMHSNADGDNIQYSAGELLKRKEQKKILIVLSDGQPAHSSGEGDIYGWTKEVVSKIEEEGDIEIYGIGIMDDTVEFIYKEYKVINSASDIETTLIELLKDHVLV